MAQMAFAEHHDMIEAFPAIEPINRSAYAFCQGERGETSGGLECRSIERGG